MASVGRIVGILGKYKPDVAALDVGGMGHVVWNRLEEVIPGQVTRFDGASTAGVNTKVYANTRAEAYFMADEWFRDGFLILHKKDREVVKQAEHIRFKYRSNGSRIIQPKVEMKSDMGYSPDDMDALAIAIWATRKHLGAKSNSSMPERQRTVKRISKSCRHG